VKLEKDFELLDANEKGKDEELENMPASLNKVISK
tara:strand:+ start:211 stop:315 length:105 start_codon:yes stop_codon:yes gene_type:complete